MAGVNEVGARCLLSGHLCGILREIVTETTVSKPLTPADLARVAEARIAAGSSANVEDVLRAGKTG